jgi:hypothetical protein
MGCRVLLFRRLVGEPAQADQEVVVSPPRAEQEGRGAGPPLATPGENPPTKRVGNFSTGASKFLFVVVDQPPPF